MRTVLSRPMHGRFLFLLAAFLLPVFCRAEVAFTELNTAFGAPLWADDSLWDDDDGAVAARIGLRPESETSYSRSYRVYTDGEQRVLGARPYSVALYGSEGKAGAFSAVFANKGDFGGLAQLQMVLEGDPAGRDRTDARREQRKMLSQLPRAIADDARQIEQALTALLGKPVAARFGQGQATTQNVQRWDWKGHAILLAVQRDAYTGVSIVPSAVADSGGRDTRISDNELRKRLAARVQRRANGDVIVGDLPMVDQGPKGFCVPATIERCLRHLGIQSDMYLLAMAGKTEAGGGTTMAGIEQAVTGLVKTNLRKIEPVPPSFRAASLARHIDAGLPVIWAMYVDRAFDSQITSRSRARERITDWKAWKESLKTARKEARKIRPPRENGHVCLIIGYNADTGEIAISDSWGPEYRERWITAEEAEAITQRYLSVITW
jgi:hypothetical protein